MNSMRANPTPSLERMAVLNARSGLPRLTMIGMRGRHRGEASSACLEEIIDAADIEKALVLSGKTCRRQVLRSRRAPNRHGDACAILFLKALVRFRYLGVQRACSSRRMDQGAGSCSILGQPPNVVLPKVFEQNAQTVPGPAASRASRSAVAVSANPLGTLTPSEDNAEYSSPNEEFFPPTSATSSDCNSPNQRT